jgi:hypothetical protein
MGRQTTALGSVGKRHPLVAISLVGDADGNILVAALLSLTLRDNRHTHLMPIVILIRIALGVLKIRKASFAKLRRETLWTLEFVFEAARLRPAIRGGVNVALLSASMTTEGASWRCLLAKCGRAQHCPNAKTRISIDT